MSVSEHFDAVKAQIETDEALEGKGYDTARRDIEGKLVRDTYWILFGGAPEALDDDRFTKPQDAASTAEYVYTVRAVSVTAAGCRATINKIIAKLAGAALAVSGRSLDKLRLTGSEDPKPDYSVRPPLFFADLEFTLVSRRA